VKGSLQEHTAQSKAAGGHGAILGEEEHNQQHAQAAEDRLYPHKDMLHFEDHDYGNLFHDRRP
jgi:hypothetical protein